MASVNTEYAVFVLVVELLECGSLAVGVRQVHRS